VQRAILLKGCTIGGKTTTLSLIGSILLDQLKDESREDLRQYFRNLYDVRGKIVHYDKDWESIADEIDFRIFEDQPSKNEYADRTQELLAETIRVYLDQMVERGTNIAETNSRIYELMQNIDYPDD
jgi:flagellin-specific chaperone FliS